IGSVCVIDYDSKWLVAIDPFEAARDTGKGLDPSNDDVRGAIARVCGCGCSEDVQHVYGADQRRENCKARGRGDHVKSRTVQREIHLPGMKVALPKSICIDLRAALPAERQ